MPSGDNSIFVTVATNGWSLDLQACEWMDTVEHASIPPATTPGDSDEFPFWYDVRHE